MDAHLSVSDGGGGEMELTEQIKSALLPMRGGSVYNAMLLLAEHVQRHDELVAAQWEYDGGVDARAMPDDRMDALCRRVRALREEIAGAAGKEWEAVQESGTSSRISITDALAALPDGHVGWAPELEPWFCAVEELAACCTREQLAYILGTRARFVPQTELDAANERIQELEDKLRYAEYALETMRNADANAADQRRMKMLERRVDAKTDEINALKRHARELEEQLEAANASYRAMHDAWVERNDTIGAMEKRAHELEESARNAEMRAERLERRAKKLEGQLAERNEDAEVGKAVREWKPKAGHIRAWIEQIRMIADGTPRYRMMWRKAPGREGHTCWHCSIADAIAEYNERED